MAEIEFIRDNDALIIKLPQQFKPDWADPFLLEVKKWVELDIKYVAIDFQKVPQIKNAHYRPFLFLAKECRISKRTLFSINIHPELVMQFKEHGLFATFNPQVSFKAFIESQAQPQMKGRLQIDVNIINPFVSATLKTIEMQAQTRVTAEKPRVTKPEEKKLDPGTSIAGVITIATPSFNGSIALVFPEKVYLQIYNNLFAESHEKLSKDLEDGAGEILNIIYGVAKSELNEKLNLGLRPVIPTVLAGDNLRVRQQNNAHVLQLPFTTDHGSFEIEIAVESKQSA